MVGLIKKMIGLLSKLLKQLLAAIVFMIQKNETEIFGRNFGLHKLFSNQN
jgi:hypothetical protein